MTPKRAKLWRRLAATVATLMMAGCVDSALPLLAGGRPVLAPRLRVHLDTRADGPAHCPYLDTFCCGGAQYAVFERPIPDIPALTLAQYGGDDLPVPARSSRPQVKGIALAREAANRAYVTDADDATRANFCANDASSRCSITERDALIAFVEATAARPDRKGHWRSSLRGADASA